MAKVSDDVKTIWKEISLKSQKGDLDRTQAAVEKLRKQQAADGDLLLEI